MARPTGRVDAEVPVWRNIALTLTGTVLGLASFFTILALMLMNLPDKTPLPPEGQLSPVEKIRQLQAEDQRKLTSYELIDKEKGTWRIPIDVAMEKLVAEAGAGGEQLPDS